MDAYTGKQSIGMLREAKSVNVRFWHLADIDNASENVRFRG